MPNKRVGYLDILEKFLKLEIGRFFENFLNEYVGELVYNSRKNVPNKRVEWKI